VTPDGDLYCVDAKIQIDENAHYRQQELVHMMQNSKASEHIDPSEKRATEHDLHYVALDGNIGCMVNGAGLAMATMDIIH